MYTRLSTLTSMDFLLCISSYKDETKYTCIYILCRQLLISDNCTFMHVHLCMCMCVHKCVYVCVCVCVSVSVCYNNYITSGATVILGVNSTGDLSPIIESVARDFYRINIHTSYIMHIVTVLYIYKSVYIYIYIYIYIYTYTYTYMYITELAI